MSNLVYNVILIQSLYVVDKQNLYFLHEQAAYRQQSSQIQAAIKKSDRFAMSSSQLGCLRHASSTERRSLSPASNWKIFFCWSFRYFVVACHLCLWTLLCAIFCLCMFNMSCTEHLGQMEKPTDNPIYKLACIYTITTMNHSYGYAPQNTLFLHMLG